MALVSESSPNPKKPEIANSNEFPNNGAGRKIRLHGVVVTENELHDYMLNLIHNEGITGTKALSQRIGKKERQTKRILDQMAFLGKIELDANNRLVKTVKQVDAEFQEKMFTSTSKFKNIPEIKKFNEKAIQRGVKKATLQQYNSSLKIIFKTMKTNPASVIVSKSSAEEFFMNYTVEAKKLYPQYKDAPQSHRTAYRIFLDSVAGISYGHGMAKGVGFGSHHASFQKYAGAHIPLDVCDDLQKMMLADNEIRVYTWFTTGIMTAGRSGAIASMTWDKINLFLDDFRLDQFETKDDSAGHVHLGEFGEWKHKFPPKELYQILLNWKKANPQFEKFVWFEDAGNDVSNRSRAKKVRQDVIPKLREYLHKVEDRLDSLTKEYIFKAKKSGHVNRHTFAQLMRNAGASDDEIAFAGGWKSKQTISWYSSVSEEEKQKSKKLIGDIFAKGDQN